MVGQIHAKFHRIDVHAAVSSQWLDRIKGNNRDYQLVFISIVHLVAVIIFLGKMMVKQTSLPPDPTSLPERAAIQHQTPMGSKSH